MVTVDQDGQVQLRGNGNVNILVNRTDLANISGSQIDRVEVITSASAKYDPEGMAYKWLNLSSSKTPQWKTHEPLDSWLKKPLLLIGVGGILI